MAETEGRKLLVDIQELCQFYHVRSSKLFNRGDTVKAVNRVDLTIKDGEALGLAGESGCGKSTLGKTLLQLIKPTSGHVFFEGRDMNSFSPSEMREIRQKMQIVFQDPYSSLNPRMTVGEILREPLRYHRLFPANELRNEVSRLLELVGLEPQSAARYPHEFSGGQRQRIAIARALSVKPRFIVCDEPVSALDVSIQAQILNLFTQLKEELGLTYLFISHDLSSLRYVCDRIAVMYLGRIVELASTDEICEIPVHPYTQALFSAVPSTVYGEKGNRMVLSGEPPSPIRPPSGCAFHKRCPYCQTICEQEVPPLLPVSSMKTGIKSNEHFAACHFSDITRQK